RAWDQTSGTAGTKVSTATNGGTTAFSAATDTIDVSVTAVNDAPVFTSLNGTPAYTENGSPVVMDNNVTITDTELTAANNFNGATLTLTRNGGANSQDVFSATGTLSSIAATSGNIVVGGTTIGTYTNSGGTLVFTFNSSATNTLVNSAMQQLAYSNSSDAPPSSVQVNWTFSDNNSGSQGSGGALTATGSTTVLISAVNDAPVLADTALSLTVLEDAGAPSGAVGSVVSAFTGGISDVDSGAAKGLAITGSNETTGTWYYTTNGGTTWTVVGTVSNTAALLLADNANTRLYFAPNANYSGTSLAVLTVRAWDQTSGTAGTKVTTASNGGTTAFSSATDTIDVSVTAVNDAPTGLLLITGTVTEDHMLTADTSSIADADGLGTFSYQWNRNGVAIVGATSSTYTLGDADVGAQISVTVSYTDGQGTNESVTSAPTAPVMNVNDAPTGLPLITGTVTEDQTLTVDTSGMADADGLGTFSYQWLRNGMAIAGVTSSTYTLGDADVGTQISVTVTYTDGQGTNESLTSAPTAPVVNVNDAPLLVTNTGSTVGEGGTDTIDASELAVTDVDTSAAQLTYSISTGPASGRLELTTAPGVSATTFTQADLAANRVIYLHDGSETTSDSFTFTVSDGAGGLIGLTTVTLTITPVNDTPTITSNGGGATAAITVAEHVSAVTIVTGQDVDLPAQALTYHISGGVDQARFSINAATGALNFTAPPDFEVATDANGDNVYVVQVQVTDSQGASTTQTIQVTVTDVVERVPPPIIPPVLVSPTPPPSTGGPTPGPGTPPPAGSLTPVDNEPVLTPVPSGPKVLPVDDRPISQAPLTLVSPPDRPVVKVPDEVKHPQPEAAKETPLVLVNDDQGRPLFSVLPVEPTPMLEPEPPETKPSVSDLLMTKLDEMTVSLEQSVNLSEEHHELMARVTVVTGTVLSVGFVAWALRSGAILASCLATMPAWQHFDHPPVMRLGRGEHPRRRDEMTRAGQEETTEFSGLTRVFDDKPPLKRTA
ncbi:MAG: cadherin domain-containing protein, partial [Nitrospira sp.]|nr:cadherin domain-containing protein [Nitrospira sp.]